MSEQISHAHVRPHDTSREPVASIADLNALDSAEIREGYFDGFDNEPCGDNRSRAYWHGWRNGRVDGGHVEKDAHQAALAREVFREMNAAPAQGRLQ